ncbi:helix-turn-helix transcriptional regulator [Azorhizobium doebereinerae]|uniref:helix-turn-helix transcriptional regulator n=1 Tax=Azorhizobium doebereinerae TaxID=281091 RepID=UPI0004194DD0|nr:hypothetical protein [Azorhizobium doebereinerae]
MSTTPHRRDVLPGSLPPRGLSRVEAAAYIGVSPGLLDEMIRDGRMPPPKRMNTRTVWDRYELDTAFSALPNAGSTVANAAWDGSNVELVDFRV